MIRRPLHERRIASALIGVSLVACADGGRARETHHPIPDSLPAFETGVRLLDVDDVPAVDDPTGLLASFSRRLAARQPLFDVGGLNGAEHETFGRVVDARIGPKGELLVLDAQAAAVRVFGPDGDYLYSLGGPGEGPGELAFPNSMVFDESGTLFVVDGGQLIHKFPRTSGRYEYEDRRVAANLFSRDACWSASSLVIHSTTSQRSSVLSVLRGEGLPMAEFATPYHYDRWLVQGIVGRGKVTCLGARGQVILAYDNQNRAESYDVGSGQLLWHVRFPSIKASDILETEDGAKVSTGVFENPFVDYLLDVTGGTDVPVVIQYQRISRSDFLERTGDYTIRTYVVAEDGRSGAFLGENIPQLLSVDSTYVVELSVDPYPSVRVSRLGPG